MSADGSPTCKIAGGHRPPLQRLFDKGGSNLTEWHVITGEYPPQAGGSAITRGWSLQGWLLPAMPSMSGARPVLDRILKILECLSTVNSAQ